MLGTFFSQVFAATKASCIFIRPKIVDRTNICFHWKTRVILHDLDALGSRRLQRWDLCIWNPNWDCDTINTLCDRLVNQCHQIRTKVFVVLCAKILNRASICFDHVGCVIHTLFDLVHKCIFDRACDYGDVLCKCTCCHHGRGCRHCERFCKFHVVSSHLAANIFAGHAYEAKCP